MDLLPPVPQSPRPVRCFDVERRKKLLALADVLLKAEPTECTARTVRYLCKLAVPFAEPAPVPRLDWLCERTVDEFDALIHFDASSISHMAQLVPQMRTMSTVPMLDLEDSRCLGTPHEEECFRETVAPRFPAFEDPQCAMGVALRGIFLSAKKPYNEFQDSNAILPDGNMQGFDECLLYGNDQASCCVKVRFCKCDAHPAEHVGCNLGVAAECAICLMLIPPVLVRHSGWGKMFSWILRQLEAVSLARQSLVLEPEATDLLRSITWGKLRSGQQHRDLVRMSNASGPLGERLITAVVEDFYTQQMANTNPLDAWAQAVEIGSGGRAACK
ncbi:unnamed protein product [Durusdinium trenchii]|uniref:Uncharacterized protein n=1 Tax=Durusdinium trenchii TaxID=1381693 RepID=A0ABP0IMU3_9DINO